MKWYHYVSVFFAGICLTNGIPHFIHGISGERFPTQFSYPRPSPPMVNVWWGAFNLLVGYLLLRLSRASVRNLWAMVVLFVAIVLWGMQLSSAFAEA